MTSLAAALLLRNVPPTSVLGLAVGDLELNDKALVRLSETE